MSRYLLGTILGLGLGLSLRGQTIQGPVRIEGDLIVTGTISASGRVTGKDLRTTIGQVRWGGDDSPETLDQTLTLHRNLGSLNKQSAIVQQPVGKTNGAILLQIPGENLPPGRIAAQLLQYGPLHKGQPRRQRFSPGTVFLQSDGHAFATLSTTLSGTGEAKGIRPMPVLFNWEDKPQWRLDGKSLLPKNARE